MSLPLERTNNCYFETYSVATACGELSSTINQLPVQLDANNSLLERVITLLEKTYLQVRYKTTKRLLENYTFVLVSKVNIESDSSRLSRNSQTLLSLFQRNIIFEIIANDKEGYRIQKQVFFLFLQALARGESAKAKYLVYNFCSPQSNFFGKSLNQWASILGNKELDTYLLTRRLRDVLAKKDNIQVQSLINRGADLHLVDMDGKQVIHEAASVGNIEGIRLLVSNGATVDAVTTENKSPLDIALDFLQEEAAAFFIEKGCLIEAKHLFIAASKQFPLVIRALVDRGMSVKAKDSEGRNALFNCFREKRGRELQTLQLLIRLGGEITERDALGRTLLHEAALESTDPEVITFLIEYFRNEKLSDNQGIMPFKYALEAGSFANAYTLLDSGVKITEGKGVPISFLLMALKSGVPSLSFKMLEVEGCIPPSSPTSEVLEFILETIVRGHTSLLSTFLNNITEFFIEEGEQSGSYYGKITSLLEKENHFSLRKEFESKIIQFRMLDR